MLLIQKLEKPDYTAVRDTPRSVTGKFSYAKICHFFEYHKIETYKSIWGSNICGTPEPSKVCKIGAKLQNTHEKKKWNEENQQATYKIESVLKVVRIHQHHDCQPIIPMYYQGNAQKMQIELVSLSQTATTVRKANRLGPKCNQFKRWSVYIRSSNALAFPPCVLRINPGNPKFDLFPWVKLILKWGNSTDNDQNLISSEGGQDTSAFQISGHSGQKSTLPLMLPRAGSEKAH